jgi:hypothetical protein
MSVVIDGTTGISGADGSAATPALRGDDPDTGVFFPTANAVSLSTGGVERVSITNNYTLVKNQVELQSDLVISNDQGFAGFSLNNGTLQLLLYTPLFNPGTFDLTGLFAISGNVGTAGQVLTSGGSGAAPSWASVGTATAGLAAGSVGSYALLNSLSVATRNSGATEAGSNLRFANTYAEGSTVGYSTETPSGTWRLMGNTGNYNATLTSTFNVQASLWLRIS